MPFIIGFECSSRVYQFPLVFGKCARVRLLPVEIAILILLPVS